MPASLERSVAAAKPLSPAEIVRAWEDRRFRARLSHAELGMLPPHPLGAARLQQLLEESENTRSNFGSCDACSSNMCSSSNCSSDMCSSSNCSSNMCSSDNCSSAMCTASMC